MAYETVNDLTGSVLAAFIGAVYLIFGEFIRHFHKHFVISNICRRRNDHTEPVHPP